ncbi:superoxide dismutase [Ni] [Persephonella sp.]
MKKYFAVIALTAALAFTGGSYAHCEVPCGIYHDKTRFDMLMEDIDTMEKAVFQITKLSEKNDPLSKNQLVRWVIIKEKHAEKFQHVIWQYFLTQRVKPVKPEDEQNYYIYLKKVELLHKLSFFAMKVKQTVDPKYPKKLRKLLKEFENLYFGKKEKEHLEKHHDHHH